jgi:hypothetical protein
MNVFLHLHTAPAPIFISACSSQNLAVLSQDETIPLQNLRLFTRQAASQRSPDKDLAANVATDFWEENFYEY